MADQECMYCGHSLGDHVLMAYGEDPIEAMRDGGVMVCPVESCNCQSTWELRPPREDDDGELPDLPVRSPAKDGEPEEAGGDHGVPAEPAGEG